MTPGPVPDPLQEQWPGAVVASGQTNFFTFVALSSAEAVRAYEPDLAAIASTGAKAAAADRRRGAGLRCRLRVARLRAQRGDRRGSGHGVGPVLGRPLLGGRAGASTPSSPTSSPGAARRSTCAPTVSGSASRGTRPRCSPASCARDSPDGESGDGCLRGGPAGPGRGPRAGVAAGGGGPGALPLRARPAHRAVRRARRPDPRDRVGHRRRAARHRAAPAQAARHLDAARRPHRPRREPRRGGAARGHRGAGPGGRASRRRARC